MKLRCRILGHKWGKIQRVTAFMEAASIMTAWNAGPQVSYMESRKLIPRFGQPYQQCRRCPHKRLLKWED